MYPRDNYRTLLHGATLCVPSKVERISDLVGFIQRSRPTRATLTPSVLQTLKPEDIPSVRDLVASGEPVSRDLEAIWSNGRRFVQIYGSQ
jgi:acyl-coenzyme A synthetase/AMP-(fatty) acid ligase